MSYSLQQHKSDGPPVHGGGGSLHIKGHGLWLGGDSVVGQIGTVGDATTRPARATLKKMYMLYNIGGQVMFLVDVATHTRTLCKLDQGARG